MNLLQLDIKQDEQDYYLKLLIDDKEFLEAIDDELNVAIFTELERSSYGNGEYLMFNCSCGVADCGGWDKIKVSHNDGIVSWNFEYDDKNYDIKFDLNFYRGEIERFKFELDRRKLILQPEHIIEPE